MSSITLDSLELQPTDKSMYFTVYDGLDNIPEFRGEDTIIPAKSGRYVQTRIKDRRTMELRGWVYGQGTTEALSRAAYRTTINSLLAKLDPTLTPKVLKVFSGVLGLASAKQINVRCINVVLGDLVAGKFRYVTAQLESVDSPPDWT